MLCKKLSSKEVLNRNELGKLLFDLHKPSSYSIVTNSILSFNKKALVLSQISHCYFLSTAQCICLVFLQVRLPMALKQAFTDLVTKRQAMLLSRAAAMTMHIVDNNNQRNSYHSSFYPNTHLIPFSQLFPP